MPSSQGFLDHGAKKAKEGDLHGALASFDAAIHRGTRNFDLFEARGKVLLRLGRASDAEADFDTAVRLQPELSTGYERRAGARVARGELSSALADYGEAIRLKPTAVKHSQRAAVRRQLGDRAGALADLDAGLAIDSRSARDLVARGELRAMEGDLDGAWADYSEAIRLDPQHAAAYAHRAAVQEAQGNAEGAVEDYGQALCLQPDLASGVRDRLELLRRRGAGTRLQEVEDNSDACGPVRGCSSSTCSTQSSEHAGAEQEQQPVWFFGSLFIFEACRPVRSEPCHEMRFVKAAFSLHDPADKSGYSSNSKEPDCTTGLEDVSTAGAVQA